MESYSHLGINQQMNQRKQGISIFFFFTVTFFIPPLKGRSIHAAKFIEKFMCSFQPLVDCHKSRIDPLIAWVLTDWKPVNETTTLKRAMAGYRDSAWAALLTPCITQHLRTQTPLVLLVQLNHSTWWMLLLKVGFYWQPGPKLIWYDWSHI